MREFIFIVGGARSGKSRYAQGLAKKIGKKIAFIATCIPGDSEMRERVRLHKKKRPRHWKVIEEPMDVKFALSKLKNRSDVVVIDCLGLFISNLLSAGLSENMITKKIASLASFLSKAEFTSIVVSNEVGGGIVPENALARKFRDLTGLANQVMARKADTVIFMQSGVPLRIKKGARKCGN
ncbi:MAG: bifunctional adenosylcobinamide kinase/adenosylcobinamide-phosphate guanylyltransferase [Omnitrophica bacterium RBG_13_46_9]|nr:MAG: bifunctional adenosylcobinamide kinase/adenosylcobinamide-phosphate guanylyltransferase [Omnitrophica bacterium RBG_13_46_9]